MCWLCKGSLSVRVWSWTLGLKRFLVDSLWREFFDRTKMWSSTSEMLILPLLGEEEEVHLYRWVGDVFEESGEGRRGKDGERNKGRERSEKSWSKSRDTFPTRIVIPKSPVLLERVIRFLSSPLPYQIFTLGLNFWCPHTDPAANVTI